MPVVDGDMPLVLRMDQEPPPSEPGPGALSGPQADGNWTMLKAAILVLAAELLTKLDTSASSELTGPEEPESGDFLILMKDGIPYLMLVDDVMDNGVADGDTGDITVSTGGTVWVVNAGVVTNAKLANMAANTVKVRASDSSGVPSDIALAASQLLGRGASGNLAPINLGTGLSMSGTTLNASGGGSSADPLNLWDFWYHSRFGNSNVAANDMFLGAAVSSGTNSTAIPTTGMAGFNSQGVFLRSSTSANGGYKYQTSSLVADYFGTISHKFRSQFMWLTAFTNVTVRLGYHDTATSTDAVDGAYFEIVGATCSAKTANNSTRTTHATTATLSLGTAYTFDIDVNAAGTEARFRVYAGNSPTPIMDVTNTTNIPTTSARAFGAGIVATESSATAVDIGILYSLGVGTVEGFARQNGVVTLAPSAFTVGQWTATAGDAQIAIDITALPSAGSSMVTALYYRLDGGTAVLLSGVGTGVRNVTGLTNATEYDVEIAQETAEGLSPWSDVKARTPAAAGGSPALVQTTSPAAEDFNTTHPRTFPVATTAGRTVVFQITADTAAGAPTVAGNDAVSFGAAIHSDASEGQTTYWFRRANSPSLTSVTGTYAGGVTANAVGHEVADLGTAPVLDSTSAAATYGSNTNPWQFAIAPTVPNTIFFGHAQLTGGVTVSSATPAGAVGGTYNNGSEFAFYVSAPLTASGAQNVEVTLNASTLGGRQGIALRAGS